MGYLMPKPSLPKNRSDTVQLIAGGGGGGGDKRVQGY